MPEARYSEQFQRAIRKAKLDLATVRAACEEILADPLNARGSHLLRYEWSGFRGADLDRTSADHLSSVRRVPTLSSPGAAPA